ncbi:trypco2 family protein [Streptomyces sp. NPDC026665]|uniref:trypco2 family protein n=1 Tax=Streptomyces sp. NPDC026665 TaxID=3154798 RepID=UPI0033DE7C97
MHEAERQQNYGDDGGHAEVPDDGVWQPPMGKPGGLAEALETLRAELDAAQAAGARRRLRFEIDEASLELLLELRSDIRPGMKLAFGVVTADLGGERGSSRTHKLTLKLKVRDEALGGRNAQVRETPKQQWGPGATARGEQDRLGPAD